MPITPPDWWFKWLSIHVSCYYIDTVFPHNLERQQALIDWVNLSAETLPCSNCEHHFKQYIAQNPLPTPQRFDPNTTPYLRWSIQAHNDVRARQNKELADIEEVVQSYKSGKIYGAERLLAPTDLHSIEGTKDVEYKLKQAEKWIFVLGGIIALAILCGMGYGLWVLLLAPNLKKEQAK